MPASIFVGSSGRKILGSKTSTNVVCSQGDDEDPEKEEAKKKAPPPKVAFRGAFLCECCYSFHAQTKLAEFVLWVLCSDSRGPA